MSKHCAFVFADVSLPTGSSAKIAAASTAPSAASTGDALCQQTDFCPANVIFSEQLVRLLPFVTRFVRWRLRFCNKQSAEDVVQRVMLGLWQWRSRYPQRELCAVELKRIAARSARNAVVLCFRQQQRTSQTISLGDWNNGSYDRWNDTSEGSFARLFAREKTTVVSTAIVTPDATGESEYEQASLGRFLWREIKQLSLRQRFALLLQKPDLIARLLQSKSCRINEIAQALELDEAEFSTTFRALPLQDEQIGELWRAQRKERLTAKQVREARAKARAKIRQALE